MEKTLYRIHEGANLTAFPRGTKVGDIVSLTESEALYERDMGRISVVTLGSDDPVPGETKGYPADAETGKAIELSDEERNRIQAGPDLGASEGLAELGQVVPVASRRREGR